MYFTLFGGYVNSDGTATPGHGGPGFGPLPAFLFEAEHGGFGGVTAGFVFEHVMPLGLKNFRIETSFAVSIFDDDEASTPLGSIHDLDATNSVVDRSTVSRQSRHVYDWSIAFKGDREMSSELGGAIALELFFRHSEDRTTATDVSLGPFRNHDVDGFFFGAMAVVQPEYMLTPSLSLVADLGAGIYGVNADARSIANVVFGVRRFNDSEATVGFRGRANGGLRFNATDSVSITLYGGVDYWSDVPVANQDRRFGAPAFLPAVKFKDLVELEAGIALTFLLGGQ